MMLQGFCLRPASNADAPRLRELVFSILREHGLSPDPASTDADLDDIEASYQARGGRFDLVEGPGGAIVGSVGLYRIDQSTVELRKMYLDSKVRGRGLGRHLLEHALAEARRLGFSRVTLETASVLRRAIALYEGYGFRPLDGHHRSVRCDRTYFLDLRPLAEAPDPPAQA